MFGETATYSNVSKSKSSSHSKHKRPSSSENKGAKISKVGNLNFLNSFLLFCKLKPHLKQM